MQNKMRSLHNSIISGWHVSVWTMMELFGKEFPPPLRMGCLIRLFKQLPNIFFRAPSFDIVKFSIEWGFLCCSWHPNVQLYSMIFQGELCQSDRREVNGGRAQSSKSYVMLQRVCAQSHTVCKISQRYCAQSCLVGIAFRLLVGGCPLER